MLLEPATRASAAKGRDSGQMTPSEVVLLAVINPHRAVAVVEAMPEAANLEPDGRNWSRIVLRRHWAATMPRYGSGSGAPGPAWAGSSGAATCSSDLNHLR